MLVANIYEIAVLLLLIILLSLPGIVLNRFPPD